MKKEEKDYLKSIKHCNGLSYEQADQEVENFENSQRQFKLMNKEMRKKDTIIKNLEKKIKTLESKLENIKQKKEIKQHKTPEIKKNSSIGKEMFMEDVSKDESKQEKQWKRFKNRIFYNMETGKDYTKTDIVKDFFIPSYVFDWAMNKLMKEDFIDSKEIAGVTRYFKK